MPGNFFPPCDEKGEIETSCYMCTTEMIEEKHYTRENSQKRDVG